MKLVSRFASICVLASVALGFQIASAQEMHVVSVKFPFAVEVGGRILPAGSYTIRAIDTTSEAPIFIVRGTGGSAASFVTSRTVPTAHALTKDDVIVDVVGQKHILSQVRLQESDSIYELARPAK